MYQDIDCTVLGLLIEKVTGDRYEHRAEVRAFRPLGMRHTSFPLVARFAPPAFNRWGLPASSGRREPTFAGVTCGRGPATRTLRVRRTVPGGW